MDGCRTDRSTTPVPPVLLATIRLGVVLALVAVLLRLLYLQLVVAPVMLSSDVSLDIRTRPLPPVRGAILAADGTVLAQTTLRTVISVHYRVLERPLNRNWVVRTAAERYPHLPRDQRERLLVQQINDLLPALARVTGQPEHVLQARANQIRRRVLRIRQAVARRLERNLPRDRKEDVPRRPLDFLFALLGDAEASRPRKADSLTVLEETWYYPLAVADAKDVGELLEFLEKYPGVRVEQRLTRDYPLGTFACHVIGYVRESGQPDGRGFRGESGVEKTYDDMLEGEPGLIREQVLSDGTRQVLSSKPPLPGANLRLTLDPFLQRTAEAALQQACIAAGADCGGCALVMDAETGALLAAASYPVFAPQELAGGKKTAWETVTRLRGSPLVSRIQQAALPPGSTFKLVVALAALQEGVVRPNERIECRGYFGTRPDRHRCWIFAEHNLTHGALVMQEAIARSCNCYFYELGMRLGPRRLTKFAAELGLNRSTYVDLPGERPALWPEFPLAGADELPVSLLNASVGQGELLVTPLHVALWTAVVAHGYLVTPHVFADAFAPRRRVPVSEEVREVVREGMLRAVREPWGTAHAALGSVDLPIAAKTGTAECGQGPPHSWCTALVDVNGRLFVITVVVEHGGKGGEVAARVVRTLAQALRPRVASRDYE